MDVRNLVRCESKTVYPIHDFIKPSWQITLYHCLKIRQDKKQTLDFMVHSDNIST